MDKSTGFLQFSRVTPSERPVHERIRDSREVLVPLDSGDVRNQAARCMDCGVPFCQSGCPLGNAIPDWNELVRKDDWYGAYQRLRATNNFPEFTGRICPAPCESACVLGLVDAPVMIEHLEYQIIERAFKEGWVRPEPPVERTGKRVAVIGSGPAGLATADQLNRAGHTAVLFERQDRIGGLLRYGIPDFKLDKEVLDRRLNIMRAEGVTFETGVDIDAASCQSLLSGFHATVLCTGSTQPRDVNIPGRKLNGIHFAWDFLSEHNRSVTENRRVDRDRLPANHGIEPINAEGKHVIVIGGGDTGSDCVGTANRQGALSVTQFEVMDMPPETRPPEQPWPQMPRILKTTSSHREGADRHWSLKTETFDGIDGKVTHLTTSQIAGRNRDGSFEIKAGSQTQWRADLVLLAIGYTGPEQTLPEALGATCDSRGNLVTDHAYATSREGIFVAGDARRGQSLVVWAISEGREAARSVDQYLMGSSSLPTRGC